MKKERSILFLTGTRADYGKLKPLMRVVDSDERFSCYIFITGMHTLQQYGHTRYEISKDNFTNTFTYMNQHSGEPMEEILANTITGLSRFTHEYHPDMIVVHGDRVETLAGAIVGSINNILVAHIEGGERSGTIDELIRHATTKMSHIHFVANDAAKSRLTQMGEEEKNIFKIGSPDIDIMMSDQLPDFESVTHHYDFPFSDYGILLYHPVTTRLKTLLKDTETLIESLKKSNKNYLVILPNNDEGSQIILQCYETLSENPRFRIYPSIRFESFLVFLKHAQFIIGNSSAGIREAPVYGIPTIDVGERQKNRHVSNSITNVPFIGHNILEAITSICNSEPNLSKTNVDDFGHGNSAELFLEALQDTNLWNTDTQKQFIDLEPR